MSTQDHHMVPSVVNSATPSDKDEVKAAYQPTHSNRADVVNEDCKLDENDHLQNDISQAGSLELGKQRQQDAPVSTDPEKHVSPRTPSKEFHFPKSN